MASSTAAYRGGSPFPMTIGEVNALDDAEFVALFGEIAEHSPWVAARACRSRPYIDRNGMIAAFANAVADAGEDDQLALIRAHPDLAGKAAIAGDVAPDSRKEQASAGLGSLTPEEYARFTELNDRYRTRFGFPFILAVKGATKDVILSAFEERVENSLETEFATALVQIERIIRFRLEERIGEP